MAQLTTRNFLTALALVALVLDSSLQAVAGARCVSNPGWVDRLGCSCSKYETSNICSGGSFSSQAYGDLSKDMTLSVAKAGDACCSCGGGVSDECSNAFADWQAGKDLPFFGSMDLSECAISNQNPSCVISQCRTVQRGSDVQQSRAVGSLTFSCSQKDGNHSIVATQNAFACTPCKDIPKWADSDGFTCQDYRNYRLCGGSGSYGQGWLSDTGLLPFSFRSFAVNGIDASQACCACGGGVLNGQDTCEIVDDIPFAANFSTVNCLANATNIGKSCSFTCQSGLVAASTHTCNHYGHVTGGRCVTSLALDSGSSETAPAGTSSHPEAWRWEHEAMPFLRLLAPFVVAGDGSMETVVANLSHFAFYTLSWVMTVSFLIKLAVKGADFEIFGFFAALTTTLYTVFVLISSHALYCHSIQRLSWLIFQIGLLIMTTGLARVQKERTITWLHQQFEESQQAQRHAAKTQLDRDRLALEPPDESVADAQDENVLQSFAANEEQQDTQPISQDVNAHTSQDVDVHTSQDLEQEGDDDLSHVTRQAGYGIVAHDIRGDIKAGAGWSVAGLGLGMVLFAMVYYFTGCRVHGKKFDLGMGRAVGQTTTEGSQTADLPIGGHHVIKSNEVAPDRTECSQTLIENDPAWFLDLGDEYTIDSVTVRGGCHFLDSNADYSKSAVKVQLYRMVEGGSYKEYRCGGDFLMNPDRESVLQCKQSRARYLRVSYAGLSRSPRRLCLCAVHVTGDDVQTILDVPKKVRPAVSNDWPLTQTVCGS